MPLVEGAIGGAGVFQREVIGEQRVHVDAALGDEAGAFRLTHGGEGPAPQYCYLAVQQVRADVQAYLASLPTRHRQFAGTVRRDRAQTCLRSHCTPEIRAGVPSMNHKQFF
ncbi:MAG: hypothetical protein ACRYF2_19070 [Janthinobacterium lividum]